VLQPKQNQPLTDAAGTRHTPVIVAPRIVSLVPSLTELICELGLARFLVGRTGFCVHPRDTVRNIPKVGGTKNVNLARIRELQPSHLIVNIDENEKPTVDALARVVPHIIVTHPLAPRDNLDLYRLLGGIFHCAERATALCLQFTRVLDAVVAACRELPRQDVLYLIWRAPWMTVSRDTYISRTLALVGWDTLPAVCDKRYPEIELDAAMLATPDHILLSSEPYRFRERHLDEIRKLLPAQAQARVALIDGEMTSWYGSRAIRGLAYLKDFRLNTPRD
jgi:ABC-type Fe3+-hydroxamate transport system substrate-binding protein